MLYKDVNYWREKDLHPLPGHMPLLEMAGRKRRIVAAKAIAKENGIEICEDIQEAYSQLFNIYYDSLLGKYKRTSDDLSRT